MIRVLIVDDQRLMCDGLKSMLETNEDIEVVGVAYDGLQAISQALKINPDIILLDIRMPEMDGVEAVGKIKEKLPNTKVIMLTTFNDREYIMNSIANGAEGYLLKDMDTDELISSVKNIMSGNFIMPATIADSLKKGLTELRGKVEIKSKLREYDLNAREIEIAQMLIEGYNNSQISNALYLSEGTVRNYVSSIYFKLGTHDRTSTVIMLKDLGLS